MICNGMKPQETPVVKEKRAKFRQKKKNEMPKLLTRAHFRTRKQDALTVIPSALDTP